MADGIIEGDIQIDGVAEAISQLQRVKAELESLSKVNVIPRVNTKEVEGAVTASTARIEEISRKAAQGVQASVNDIKTLTLALNNAYRQMNALPNKGTDGGSNEQSAYIQRQITALEKLRTTTLANLKEVDTAAVAAEAAENARQERANARMRATVERLNAEKEASAATTKAVVNDAMAQIAAIDALILKQGQVTAAQNRDRVRLYSQEQAGTPVQGAALRDPFRSVNPDQIVNSDAYINRLTNQYNQEQHALRPLTTDTADEKARKLHELDLLNTRFLEQTKDVNNRFLEARRQQAAEYAAELAKIEANEAQQQATRDKYYDTKLVNPTLGRQRYEATRALTAREQIEADYQEQIRAPLPENVAGTDINKAVRKRADDAARVRREALQQLQDENKEFAAHVTAQAAALHDQSRIAEEERKSRLEANPTATDFAPRGGSRIRRMNPEGELPKGKRNIGRTGVPLPQVILDENFEEDLVNNPPIPGGERAQMQAERARQYEEARAKVIAASAASNRAKQEQAEAVARTQAFNQPSESVENRIAAHQAAMQAKGPSYTAEEQARFASATYSGTSSSSVARGSGPAKEQAVQQTTRIVAEEEAKQTAIITEEEAKQTAAVQSAAADQWVAKKMARTQELEAAKKGYDESVIDRNTLARQQSEVQRQATAAQRRYNSPGGRYQDRVDAERLQGQADEVLLRRQEASRVASEKKRELDSLYSANRQEARQDDFSANGNVPGSLSRAVADGGGRPVRRTTSTRFIAESSDDALAQIRGFIPTAQSLRAAGQRVVINIEAVGGFETIEEIRRVTHAAHQATGEEGRATIHMSATGPENAAAQNAALTAFGREPQFANIAYTVDTSGQADANRLAKESTALRLQQREEAKAARFEQMEAAAITKQSAQEEKQFIAASNAARRDNEKAIRDQEKAERDRAKAVQAANAEDERANKARTQPFSQTANTQSRSVLGVPFALAGPVAAGVGVGLLGKEAIDYQTFTTQIGNQTNLTTDEIKVMSDTIRAIPSGSANLKELAQGFKNITDLGFSAADSQQIATEESKAATAAGSDQAVVMLAITSSMKDYNAEAQDVAKFTNTTVEAARLANSSFETWSDTTRRATAIAAAYKVPLEEVDAMLVALTRHGFNTAQANTQVAGLIQNIVAPTPTAKREIDSITQRTGIDLATDFSQQGLAGKGLKTVLDDVAKATAGDEAEIRKLVPALRGGQALLLLTTSASKDFTDALGLLGQTVDGSLKPVEEGFGRIQNTVGYQFGQALKQLKLDAIDVGQALLPTAQALLDVFGAIPTGVQKSAIEFAILAGGAKALAIGFDFIAAGAKGFATGEVEATTTAAAATVATTTQTAALTAQNTTLGANIALWRTNAVAKDTALFPMVGGSKAAATIATDAKVEAGFAAKVTGAVGAAAAAIGTIIIPVTLGIAVGKTITDLGVRPFFEKGANSRADQNPDVKQAQSYIEGIGLVPTPEDAVKAAKYAHEQIAARIKWYNDTQRKAGAGGFLHGTPFEGIANWAGINSDMNINPIVDKLVAADKAIEDAKEKRLAGLNPTARKKAEGDVIDQGDLDAQNAQEIEQQNLLERQKAELLAKGAPAQLVETALFGTGSTLVQQANAKKTLEDWTQQYDKVQAAAKSAQTVLNGIDLAKGIAGLAGDADKLREVNVQLAKVGAQNPQLTGLQLIADKFKAIKDAEDDASSAYNGYLLTLDESDRRIQVLEALQKRVQDATTAAQGRVDAGVGTPQDKEFLKQSPDILGNIAKDIADLRSDQIPDLLGLSTNVPKMRDFQSLTKQVVDEFGGNKVLEATLHANVTEAKSAIQAVVDGPWNAYVNLNMRDATKGPPIASTGDFGQTASGPGDDTNGPPPPFGSPGTIGPATLTNVTGKTFNTYRQLSPGAYTSIVKEGSAGGASPFLQPGMYESLIRASKERQVDPRAILSFTKFENNNGTNISDQLKADHNYGGIKYIGQKLAHQGAKSPEGDYYAAFDNDDDFFSTIAANLSTGDYQKDYESGNLGAIAQRYVAGNTQPTLKQAINIAARVADYSDLYGRYPVETGGPLYGTNDVNAGPTQGRPRWMNPVGNAKYIVTQQPFQKTYADGKPASHADLGAYDLAVPEGTPLYAAAAGKVVESGFSKDGYGNSEVVDVGDGIKIRYGHLSQTGVKVGDEVKAGQEIGLSGSTGNSTGPHLHFEVTVNGQQVDPSKVGFNFDDPTKMGLIPNQPGMTYPGTKSEVNPADPRYKMTPMYDATAQARVLAGNLKEMDPRDLGFFKSRTDSFGQYAKSYYENQPEFFGNKGAADTKANSATLNFAIVYARTLADARHHTERLVQDYKDLEKVGGAMADGAIAFVKAQVQVNQLTDQNLASKKEMKAIDEKMALRNITRQGEDRDIAKAALIKSRGIEDDDITLAKNRRKRDRDTEDQRIIDQNNFDKRQRDITDKTNTENDNEITPTRKFEDRSRKLQFDQQVRGLDQQNAITDLQKRQRDTNYQRTAQEQLLAQTVRGAGSNLQAGQLSAQLGLMHEGDLARKDADTKALDDLQQVAQLQSKKDALESYNLQTEIITERRQHEDRMHNIDLESRKLAIDQQDYSKEQAKADLKRRRDDEDDDVRTAAKRLQDKRDDEDAAIRLANNRQIEDDTDNARKVALQASIDQNDELIKGLTDYQQGLDDILQTWQGIAGYAGSSGDAIATAFGHPPEHHASGGLIGSGFAIVGDGPQGQILPSTEVVHNPGMAVTNLRQLLATPPAQPAGAGAGAAPSVVVPLHYTNNSDDEMIIRSVLEEVERRLREQFSKAKNSTTRLRKARGA